MNKLKQFLASHADKLGHFAAGFIVFTLSFLLFGACLPTAKSATAISMLLVWIVAGVKELRDATDPEHHTFDGWDAYWTVAGGLFSFLIVAGVSL